MPNTQPPSPNNKEKGVVMIKESRQLPKGVNEQPNQPTKPTPCSRQKEIKNKEKKIITPSCPAPG
jgi:hypothetical protein